MRNRIALLIPYFGKWPEWIELYFYSCGKNPQVDFHFFTDCPLPNHQYANTIFHPYSFEGYCQEISQQLQVEFHPQKSYKLCDCKQLLGVIHRELLQGYDFWGFGDIDLVYGNLDLLLNDEMLSRYDLITTHNTRIAGHLTVIRNTEEWRRRCLSIPGWQEKLLEPEYVSLDETYFTGIANPQEIWVSRLYRYLLKPFVKDYGRLLDRFNPWINPRCSFVEYDTSPLSEPVNGVTRYWRYLLQEGKVFAPDGKELPYLHYLFFKKTPWHQTDYYWRPGYWKLDADFEKYQEISFCWNEVSGR